MIHSIDPRTGESVGDPFPLTSDDEVDAIVGAALAAGPAWRSADRAAALEAVAAALEANVEELWRAADAETALGETRLRGEVGRAAGQFRLFAQVLRDGGHVEAVIDHATAQPPVPDLRRMNHPLPGVAGVFAASNFPFAFSVAGGDTASALAAGCPVVVKAHDGHPATSELSWQVIRHALPDPDLLGLVRGLDAGKRLAVHPSVAAVGFTGSIPGGKAIQALIAERPDPIPFYGELGAASTPSSCCPRPPARASPRGSPPRSPSASASSAPTPGWCSSPTTPSSWCRSPRPSPRPWAGRCSPSGCRAATCAGWPGSASSPHWPKDSRGRGAFAVTPQVFVTDLATFAADLPDLVEECFGPAAVVVVYDDPADLPPVLERLDGSLTATIHATDPAEARGSAEVLLKKAGRLIWNGWPTGVAVRWAMHHGGPWPASTAAAHTSVGAAAIRRWLVPTAYQDWPAELLPPELRDDNPPGIPRRVDGVLVAGRA
ncbi:aldehyde dehydrogenase family protein [Streptosporangium vulgare]|uniref:aldehyde dehydrogenase family protein n=1 Tax=Streptosporangium vulgare TaxID=46190 RepID=UPI0031DDD97D